MTLRLAEGFETFGSTVGGTIQTGLDRRYGEFHGLALTNYDASMQLAAGRNGGYSAKSNYTYQYFYYAVAADDVPTNDTWIVGVAVKFDSSFPEDPSSNGALIALGHTSASYSYFNLALKLLDNGRVAVYRGSTQLEQTADQVYKTDQWHYFELKVVCHDTAGSYEVRVDGITVLSDTNIDARAGGDTRYVRFRMDEYNQYMDDIYICDTDGTTNNDFLGQVVIEGILPNADGDSSDWTPASGTDNSAMVDDIPPDDETSYVESNTENAEDLYDYADLATITTEPIVGVQVNTDVCMNEFPGDIDLYQTVKSGSTASDGPSINIAKDDYEVATRILETDPNTSSAWTASGVNGTQFGIKVGT